MRNTANKMTNPIDPIHKFFFCHLLKYMSEMDLRLSLRLSLIIKAHARLATSQLRNSSLSQSKTDMWFSAFKTTRPVPLPEVFVTTYPTRSRPEIKNHYSSVSVHSSWSIKILGDCNERRADKAQLGANELIDCRMGLMQVSHSQVSRTHWAPIKISSNPS